MGLDQYKIRFVIVTTLFCLFLLPALHLLIFSPLLVILFYQRSRSSCLQWALACGLAMDLLSSETRLGTYALNYCLTVTILYGQKKNFFADSVSTLPLMTFFFSVTSSSISLAALRFLNPDTILTLNGIAANAFAMPLADSVFAFLIFTLPVLLIKGRPRSGKDYFMS